MNPKFQSDVALGSAAMLLCLALFASPAMAGETTSADRVPLKTMNQAEYETYREQLRQHEKGVAPNTVEQKAPVANDEADAQEEKPKRSGYGQGYRARAGRGGMPDGGGRRGGMMNRGAMRR